MKINKKILFIWSVLGPFKSRSVLLFTIMFVAAISEALGMGMIIPFLSVFLGGQGAVVGGGAYVELLNSRINGIFGAEYRLLGVCLILFSLYLIKNIMYVVRIGYSMYFTNSLREYWTTCILNNYLTMSYSEIIAQKKGTLINNLIPEPLYASKSIKFLAGFLSQAILALALIVTMLMVNWRITLAVMFFAVLIFAVFFRKTKRYSVTVGEARITLNQSLHTQAEEALNGFRQVKLYSLEGRVAAAIKKDLKRLVSIITRFSVIESLAIPVGETIVIGGLVATLIYIRYFTETSVGTVLPTIGFFLIICYRLFRVLSNLFSQRMSLLSFLPSLKLVNSLLGEHENEVGNDEAIKKVKTSLDGDIRFDKVSFSYPDSEPVLSAADMIIEKGQVTALIGKSGAGKSTLLDLLSGFYDNYDGHIMVGDHELRDMDLQGWRSIVGFVTQDVFIFNTTVRDNILLGNSQATEEEVIEATREAGAYDFITALPRGFDTVLGDRGMGISGGERQRISIARALVRNPELLIFDEATSALDKGSQRLIQEMISRMKGSKTILIIAHNSSFVSNADMVYNLKSGQISRLGSFEDFSKTNTGTDL